jgi:CRISPR-associated protein Csm2
MIQRQPSKPSSDDISQEILAVIKSDKLKSLKDYPIRQLVQQAEVFGPELKRQRLETNQIRKFLDAINQIKAKLVGDDFSAIETDVVLLKPKLAYTAKKILIGLFNSLSQSLRITKQKVGNNYASIDNAKAINWKTAS